MIHIPPFYLDPPIGTGRESSNGSDSAGNLTRTQATGAGVNLLGRTVDDSLHAFDVGTPRTIGASVRVRHFDTERNSFTAEITFCHFSAPPSMSHRRKNRQIQGNRSILADFFGKSKFFFASCKFFLKSLRKGRFCLVIFYCLRYTTIWKFIECY